MCRGTGGVLALSEGLLIGDRRAAPEDEELLHPAAAAIMKGIRRSELLPFLKRMSEEGLWENGVAFHRLDEASRHLLLFGCWTRPGHGTFLKDAKADPQEVGAWLRWDGLHAHIEGQLERSTDVRWRDAVERSRSTRPCPGCEGTGLGAVSTLLRLGERSWRAWVREGTIGELSIALKRLSTSSERQRRACQRLLQCLEPLAGGGNALRAPADALLLQEVSRRVVQSFTEMPVLPG
jgi:excinuclease UvrABC ATPase subunit